MHAAYHALPAPMTNDVMCTAAGAQGGQLYSRHSFRHTQRTWCLTEDSGAVCRTGCGVSPYGTGGLEGAHSPHAILLLGVDVPRVVQLEA